MEAGTTIPLRGAIFEVVNPEGNSIGTFSTNDNGEIVIPLTISGNYTVYERQAPQGYLLSKEPSKNVKVEYGKQSIITFENEPYGSLQVKKYSNTGIELPGAVIRIQHIESGTEYTAETNFAGIAIFDKIKPGAYRIQEIFSPIGYIKDDTVFTTTVVAGETVSVPIINQEKPGLRILKYDSKTQQALPDITFEISKDTQHIGRFKTDEFGEILLTDLEPGTYTVKEIATDSSHIVNSTPQQIELQKGDGILQLIFFNDQKPGIHLVKLDSNTLQRIPNAKFRIEQVGGTFSKEYITDKNGEIDLKDLEPGAYQVTELAAPDGYLIDDATRIIQINGNDNAEFVFTNTHKPAFRLVKLDSFTGTGLPGATFRIAKIEDGSHYLDRITDTNGEINISDLEPGIYSVQETKAPEGYEIDPTEYHVELFPGKTSELVVSNDRKPNLEIVKTDAITGKPVAEVTFKVKKADSSTVTTVKTDAEGKALLTKMDPGVYEIWETSVPDDYLLNDEHQFITLVPNRTGTVRFQNFPKPTLTINKVDSITGDPIKGVKFKITYASNNTFTGEINDLGVHFTDENGQIKIGKLKDGWYRITELEPAPGYSIKEPATQECYIEAGRGKTLTFENTPLSALVIYKYDSVTGEALPGARFQVKYLAGTSGTGGTVIGTYVTSANGSITVTGLKAGTYVVEEVSSPNGHVIDTEPQTVYISGKDQDVVKLYFGNSPKGSLLIKKIDAKTHKPLSDVQFFVTKSDGTVVGNGNGYFTTDSQGTILIDGIDPGTTLVAKETIAKDGYLLDNTPQTAQIKAGQTVTLEFRNQPKGGLIINKLDSVTHKPLEGVEFEIKYADGSYVDAAGGTLSSKGKYWTDKNGQIILSEITGTVVVTETKTIPGYTIHAESRSQTVVVNPNDTQTLYFYNDPVGGVEIIKVNEDDQKERIPNTTFEIRKLDDELIDTATTDKNGRVFVSLQDGAYYAKEIKAAEGFRLDDTPHYFEVENGKTSQLVVTNKALSGIIIHKIDSVTEEGIYGVKFVLYDKNHKPIGEYTTDNKGYIYIDEIPGGLSGQFYLRELEAASGYELDKEYKRIHVQPGKTIEIEWENTPVTGQIQIIKYSAEYNEVTGTAPGTPLKGAVYEIVNPRNNKVVDHITTDARGIASRHRGIPTLAFGTLSVEGSHSTDLLEN